MGVRLLLMVLGFIACKARDHSQNKLQLQFGETRVAAEDLHLTECKSLVQTFSLYADIDQYLSEIAAVLLKANPETFRDRLAPGQFCFMTLPAKDQTTATDGISGLIAVSFSDVIKARSDAEVASFLAHELAHVSRMHRLDTINLPADLRSHSKIIAIIHENSAVWEDLLRFASKSAAIEAKVIDMHRYELFRRLSPIQQNELKNRWKNLSEQFWANSDPKWFAVTLEFAEEYALQSLQETDYARQADELMGEWADLTGPEKMGADRFVALKEKLRQATNEIEADRSYNWKEQEADELGLQFYLRAGFAASSYLEMFSEACPNKNIPTKAPPRGQNDHPHSCWRIWNIRYRQLQQEHRDDYAKFASNRTTAILPGYLERLKKKYEHKFGRF